MFQFCPGNGASLNTARKYSPNAATQVVSDCDTGAFTISNVTGYRVVSAGARWFDVSAATDAGGYVIATEHQNFNSFDGKSIATSNENATGKVEVYDRRQPCTWLSRATDTNAYNFASPSVVAAADSANRRSCLTLAATGKASSNIMVVECVINYEFEITADAFTSNLASSSPNTVGNRLAAQAAYDMESSMSTFIARKADDAIRYIENQAAKYAWTALKGTVGALMGGPRGAMLAIEVD